MTCAVCIGESSIGRCDCYDDEADDSDMDECDDDEPPYPDFGCACENALIVDTVCAACIEWMREQEDEIETPETGTVGP